MGSVRLSKQVDKRLESYLLSPLFGVTVPVQRALDLARQWHWEQ